MITNKTAAVIVISLILGGCSRAFLEEPAIVPKPVSATYSGNHFQRDTLFNSEGICEYARTQIDTSLKSTLGEEGYKLSVTKKRITASAATQTGLFYANQTLRQLTDSLGIRCAEITDYPRFGYRGVHLDVSRYFFPKEEVFKILDEMAYYKLNNFHFHLTDNGGWRIQIDKYPKLTELGAYRVMKDWDGWWELKERRFCTKDTPGAYGGFYTKDDIREIVAHAEKLHINVIPEIEFPAHSDAVFVGYPELSCEKRQYGNGEFCLSNEDVYEFGKNVLSEVMELFPSKIIHIGADEAKHNKCDKCKAYLKEHNLTSFSQMQNILITRLQDFLNGNGREIGGWDQILDNENLSKDAVLYAYRGEKNGIAAANKGIKTVMTPGEILYFDWYAASPSKEPKAMGGYSPLKKMHSFDPVPVTAQRAAFNEGMVKEHFVSPDTTEFIHPENAKYIIGVQGCCWAEYIPTEEHLEYMMFPRLLAISEKGWSPEGSSSWNDFKERVNKNLPVLISHGLRPYDLHDAPEITAAANGEGTSVVTIDAERTDADVRYTLDGSEPDVESLLYTVPFETDCTVTVKAAAFKDGEKTSYTGEKNIKAGEDTANYYKFEL